MEKVSYTLEEMGLKELKALVLSLELLSKDDLKALKPDAEALRNLVKEWEEAQAVHAGAHTTEEVPASLGYFQGKKVVKTEDIVINKKPYTQITVETGEVFTERTN